MHHHRRIPVLLAIPLMAALAACGGDKATAPQIPASIAGNWLVANGSDSLDANLTQSDTVVTGTGFLASSELALITGGATHIPLAYAGYYTSKGKLHLDATSSALPSMTGTLDAQALSANSVRGTFVVKENGIQIFSEDTVLTRQP